MQAITLEIILRAVFGVREGERLERLRFQLRRLLDMVTDPKRAIFLIALGPERIREFGPFKRDIARVDSLIYDEIAERRGAEDLGEREDILSLMLQARHEDGTPMSDTELRDELVTLLVAGHETTATSLAWAVERLVRHPDKLERLTAEVADGPRGVPDRRDPGDAAAAPGDLAREPHAEGADGVRRLRAARRA